MLPDNKILIVIIDITRFRRYMEYYNRHYSEFDIAQALKYKLVKENCVIVEYWDHRSVDRKVIEGLNQVRREGGISIRLPEGVISIERFTLRRHSIVLECSGCGGEFSSTGTVRDQDTYLRSRVYGKTEGRRNPRRRY